MFSSAHQQSSPNTILHNIPGSKQWPQPANQLQEGEYSAEHSFQQLLTGVVLPICGQITAHIGTAAALPKQRS